MVGIMAYFFAGIDMLLYLLGRKGSCRGVQALSIKEACQSPSR